MKTTRGLSRAFIHTQTLPAFLERLARKSEVYVHINPGCCHEQQKDEGIPENVTGLLEAANQVSKSQRNSNCSYQQCKPYAGINCDKYERVDQDNGQSNEGQNNADGFDHVLKMRVKIQKLNKQSRPVARILQKKGGTGTRLRQQGDKHILSMLTVFTARNLMESLQTNVGRGEGGFIL